MTIFYDFNIAPKKEIIDTLEKFKYSGACIFYNSKNYDNDLKKSFNELNESTKLNLYCGIYINETNPQILRRTVQKYYQKVDLIMANGINTKINRSICEMPQIDIINHPYMNKHNSGINHILAKMLSDNNISVNINMSEILHKWGYYKAKLLNQINQLLMLQKKYGFRIITSSGSKSFYDVRSPEGMILLTQLMNMDYEYGKSTISTNPYEIIKNITKRKDSVVEGVRIIKN